MKKKPEVNNNAGIFIPGASTPCVNKKNIIRFLEGEALSYKDFAQLLYEQGMWDGLKSFTKTLISAFLTRIYRDGRQIYDSDQGEITHITNEQPKELAVELAKKLDFLHAVTVVAEGVEFMAAPNGSLLAVKVKDWRGKSSFVILQFDFAEWKRFYKTDELPGVIQAIDVGY